MVEERIERPGHQNVEVEEQDVLVEPAEVGGPERKLAPGSRLQAGRKPDRRDRLRFNLRIQPLHRIREGDKTGWAHHVPHHGAIEPVHVIGTVFRPPSDADHGLHRVARPCRDAGQASGRLRRM